MKKVFIVAQLLDEKLSKSILEESQVIAYRKDNKLYYQNVDFYPERSGCFTFSPEKNEVTISFKLRNGEFLAVGSESGMADKHEIIKI